MLLGSIFLKETTTSSQQNKVFYSELFKSIHTLKKTHNKASFYFKSNQIISNGFQESNYYFEDKENEIIVFTEADIYNKIGLAKSLAYPETNLKIPALLAKAFLRWGPNFVDRINGDFSIIIYLPQKKEILFFRDHLGIRPLAIAHGKHQVYFSTDPMGLAKVLYGNKRIDEAYLKSLFFWTDTNIILTPHKNLTNVKAGHYLHVTPHKTKQIPYWFPETIYTDQSLSQKTVISELTALVKDAVQLRSDKNYTAGAHLSGGLDSGTVAAFARKEYLHQPDFYGFSWSPKDEINTKDVAFDERPLIEKTAYKNNITPLFSEISIEDYRSFVSDWRHPSEMIYEHKTVLKAKEKGVNLIFSGWGGDEFISIGHRGVDPDLIRQDDWLYFLKKYPISQPRTMLRALIYSALFPSIRRPYSKYKAEHSIFPYLKKHVENNRIPRKKRFRYTSRRKVHLQLLEMGHLGARTADWYVHGQRHGVEYRYPLLDKRIIEYMLRVPSRCLVGQNNYRILLRIIAREVLPKEVLQNTSKDDPLKSQQFYKFAKKQKRQLISEFEDFRQNPDLAFVDFELLEKNIPTILNNVEKGKDEDGTAIFYYLKAAHEFTKGYYN